MEYCAGNFFLIVIVLIITFLTYFKWKYGYWKRRGVPYIEPKFPFGNLQNPFTVKRPFTMDVNDFHKEMKKRGEKFGGFYFLSDVHFIPIDPELIKCIMTKDFSYFVNHGIYFNEKDDPLSGHLFAIEDEKWRNLRNKLTPTFTSGKMKMMFKTVMDCTEPFKEELSRLYEAKEELDIKELASRFTIDIIGSCAFGLECNSFKSPDAEFRKYGKMALENQIKPSVFLMISYPEFSRKIGLKVFNNEVNDFFFKVVKDTIRYREDNNYRRNDFMQLLIDLKNNEEKDGGSFTLNELTAQAFVFFLAGFETSSTTLTYCLFELALNQNIQDKVREEIERVVRKYDGKVTYEGIQEMKYMEQTLNETLRKYPPLPLLTRKCNKEYQVPNSNVIIEKGTKLFISSYSIHRDQEFYPDPEKFNPDRFSEENKSNMVPYTFLPFGEGPRVCIGLRFGMMQVKVGLISILRDFKLKLSSKTSLPLTFDPKNFILTSKQTIYLESERIEKINKSK